MRSPLWALALLLPVLLHALKTAPGTSPAALDLLEKDTRPGQELDLLEQKKEKKKWNWKEASEESKTEWAIVLKRYVLSDMVTFELGRHFGEALPGTSTAGDRQEALDMVRSKLARLESNLKKAVLDQNTSDATAGDMQKESKSNLLTMHEKRILADEHKREQYGFFAVEASSQDVLEKAKELLQALETNQTSSHKEQPSWSSIVAAPSTPKPTYMSILNVTNATQNSTGGNATSLRGSKLTVEALFAQFGEACNTFHADLGRFESMRSKALTSLLSVTN